jgi:hypothetical protein
VSYVTEHAIGRTYTLDRYCRDIFVFFDRSELPRTKTVSIAIYQGGYMSTVFISYRRQAAAGEARALFNDLVARLGHGAVFMDVDSISLGRDFRSELQKTLATCDVMLVIIDRDWALAKDGNGRKRLESAGDYVRMEVETALKRDIAVTPVLIQGAQMPAPEELPAEIRDLAFRNGFELSHNRWESDLVELIRRLRLVASQGKQVETDDRQMIVDAGEAKSMVNR